MKFIFISIACAFLTGCANLPQILSDTEHMVDDTAIKVEISQEAIKKETNISLRLNVTNSKKE